MDCDEPNAERQTRPNENDVESDENAAAEANDVVVAETQNEENERDEIGAVAVPNVVQTGEILKLDIDCFDEAFDYLPLEDLASIGRTCKRLQRVAGYCLRQNYSEIRSVSRANDFITLNGVDITHLAQFIRRIQISNEECLEYFLNTQSKLSRLGKTEITLKQIAFFGINFTRSTIERMKNTLNKVEALRLSGCQLKFDEIIGHCSNLRRLEVKYCNESDFDWLNLKCPTLECFDFTPLDASESIKEIMTFLKQNPDIQKLAIKANNLWTNRHIIKNASDIKLDVLAVGIDSEMEFGSFCQLLNALHKRGFYKRLQMYIYGWITREMVNRLATIKGLMKLYIVDTKSDVTFSSLTDIEELRVDSGEDVADAERLANKFINLKRIHWRVASIDDIIPFIRRSVVLDKIKVNKLGDSNANVVDLPTLNREREQLPNARKITMYVDEKVYLATKWAFNETNFPMICLKRFESFEWHHDFNFY